MKAIPPTTDAFRLTDWIVSRRILTQPIVVLDVGCGRASDPIWNRLGEALIYHGINPNAELICQLRNENAQFANRTFHHFAIGYVDEESQVGGEDSDSSATPVSVRKLDTIYRDGSVPGADYMIMDCEGFEPEILDVGRQYLNVSAPILLETRVQFDATPRYPETHFNAVARRLGENGLDLFDLRYRRVAPPMLNEMPWPEVSFPRIPLKGPPVRNEDDVEAVNALFCRDFTRNARKKIPFNGKPVQPIDPLRIIKALVLFELSGRIDWAFHHLAYLGAMVEGQLDIQKARELLLRDLVGYCDARISASHAHLLTTAQCDC